MQPVLASAQTNKTRKARVGIRMPRGSRCLKVRPTFAVRSARGGRLGCGSSGGRLAVERSLQADASALARLQVLALEGGGQPLVTLADVPDRSVGHERGGCLPGSRP